jgi:hypothetical protein
MRRIILIASLAAMVMVVVSAVPALAQQNNDRDDRGDRFQNRVERFEDDGFFFDEDRFERDRFDNGSGISQSSEQEANSGDVDQSFDVSGGGDNSNQTVGLQGVANTGNAQNQIDFTDFGNIDDFDRFDRDDFDRFDRNGSDFSFEDSGASIEVSPTNMTSSDQEVNQAASAFGR